MKASHKGEIMEMSRISIRSRLAATTAAVALVGGATLATASPASGAAGGATIIRTDETGEVVVCDDGVLTVTSGVFKIVVHETLTPSGAYHLGAHQATKYLARPCDALSKRAPSRKGDDYLSRDLIAAAGEGLCFTFAVQFQADVCRIFLLQLRE